MIDDWKADILKEGSLQEVYLVSRRLPKSTFNRVVYVLVIITIGAVVLNWISRSDIEASRAAVIAVADIAFDLTVQILGFLIGGFAIFATVTDAKLMTRLAQTPMPDSDVSVFKIVFFNFLSVFYIYVVVLSVSIVVRISAVLTVMNLAEILEPSTVKHVLTIINGAVFGVLAFLCAIAVVRLKSFIWNIYQAFLTFLSVSEIMDQEKKKRSAPRRSKNQTGAQ